MIQDEQTTPWVFFFFFRDAEWLINSLRQYDIFASDFPNLHPKVFGNKELNHGNLMYQHSVTLPVHQDLKEKDIRSIATKVKVLVENGSES
jgi:dTDP-4-amino-4,6-dideoxygalactose transaminase